MFIGRLIIALMQSNNERNEQLREHMVLHGKYISIRNAFFVKRPKLAEGYYSYVYSVYNKLTNNDVLD